MSFCVTTVGLAVGDGVVVELLAAGDVQQRLRIRRPDRHALLVVEIGDLLRRAALRIRTPTSRRVRSGLRRRRCTCRRPTTSGTGCATPSRSGLTRVMSPRSVAIVRIWPRAEMAARRPDGEMSNASDVVADGAELDLVFLVVGAKVDPDFVGAAAGHIELPDAEVVFVDDRLAVGRHRRPEQAAVAMFRDLHGLPALRGNPVDVVDAPIDVGAARLDVLFVRQRIGNEIDRIVGAPHRPVAVVALIGEQRRIALVGEVGDPEVGGVAAAIVAARPGRRDDD